MKKIISRYILILIATLTVAGCGDFGDLNKNPNKPSEADNRFLFMDAARHIRYFHIVGTYNPFPQHFSHYWAERLNVQYTALSLNSFAIGATYYTRPLKDLNEIIKTNVDQATVNQPFVSGLGASTNQLAIARTLKAFIFMHLTDALGMIPYSEAFQAKDGNYNPKYDSQESIYADLDKELTEAYAQLNPALTFNSQYDIFYKGDIKKWQKFNASVRMLLAIKMSNIDPTNGQKRFAAAYKDGGITKNEDNFNYYYLTESDNENPLYTNIFITKRSDFAPTTTIMDILTKYSDPRKQAYFAPNREGNYVGVPFGMRSEELSESGLTELASGFTERFTKQNAVGTIVSASQMLLHAAEASLLGWISDDVNTLYKNGITASFMLNNIAVDKVDSYITHDDVKLSANKEADIKKVSIQKWIQGFGQDCFESWSEWRRNRVPDLRIGPAAGAALEGKPMPDRMYYGSGDYTTNRAEYDKAVSIQGKDYFFTKLWWDTSK